MPACSLRISFVLNVRKIEILSYTFGSVVSLTAFEQHVVLFAMDEKT